MASQPSSSQAARYTYEDDVVLLQHAGLPQNTSLAINKGKFQSVELAVAGWWLAHERYVFQATAMTFEKATCMHTKKRCQHREPLLETQAGLIGPRNAASQQPNQQHIMCNILGSLHLCGGDGKLPSGTDSPDVPISCMAPDMSCLLTQRTGSRTLQSSVANAQWASSHSKFEMLPADVGVLA